MTQKIQSIADDLSLLTDKELRMLASALQPEPAVNIAYRFLGYYEEVMIENLDRIFNISDKNEVSK